MFRHLASQTLSALLVCGALLTLLAGPAGAGYTLDRWYQMGDDLLFAGGASAENAADGAPVGSGTTLTGIDGGPITYDSAATNNDNFQPLAAFDTAGSLPTYAQFGVGGNPPAPVAGAASMNSFAVRLDGVDDYLAGLNLNDPSVSVPGSVVSYSTQDRGMQFWAFPTDLDGVKEVLVDDGDEHGVNINANGAFEAEVREDLIGSGLQVAANAWNHVMIVHDSSTLGAAVTYIDGVAAATQNLDYDSNSIARLLVGANSEVDEADLQLEPSTLATPGFYAGLIDELEMFVLDDGAQYGRFDYATDNAYFTDVFLPSQAGYGFTLDPSTGHNSEVWTRGDFDFDGDLDADDLQAFKVGWLNSRSDLPGAGPQVGDYTTIGLGDLDIDGDTDVDDWFALRALGPAFGAPLPSLGDLSTAPEPSAVALVTLVVGMVGGRRRNR